MNLFTCVSPLYTAGHASPSRTQRRGASAAATVETAEPQVSTTLQTLVCLRRRRAHLVRKLGEASSQPFSIQCLAPEVVWPVLPPASPPHPPPPRRTQPCPELRRTRPRRPYTRSSWSGQVVLGSLLLHCSSCMMRSVYCSHCHDHLFCFLFLFLYILSLSLSLSLVMCLMPCFPRVTSPLLHLRLINLLVLNGFPEVIGRFA